MREWIYNILMDFRDTVKFSKLLQWNLWIATYFEKVTIWDTLYKRVTVCYNFFSVPIYVVFFSEVSLYEIFIFEVWQLVIFDLLFYWNIFIRFLTVCDLFVNNTPLAIMHRFSWIIYYLKTIFVQNCDMVIYFWFSSLGLQKKNAFDF